ncbi:MAG: acyltransferase [Oscillospiraceae bacterium]|nr:acyltransferase [Oscillospiraceae bacterium]
MKRIYSLDVLKLVFAYIIAFFHFGTEIAPGPTVTVQVFFIISGFFLAKKYYSRSYPDGGYSAWDYSLDHVKGIYPHYLFSLMVLFAYMLARSLVELVKAPSWAGLAAIAEDFYYQIPDLFLLQSSYRFHESYNYPLWQLSALVIAGYFVYALLCHNEKLSRRILFPAAILMIQSLLNTGVDLWENYALFYVPLLRAFSPLCIGVLAFYFTTTPLYEKVKGYRVPFNLAVLGSLVSIFVYSDRANIFLITTVILLWGCYDESSWINKLLNHRIFKHCGKFSYAIYLNHALIARLVQARVLSRFAMVPWQQNVLYFGVLTVYSVFTLFLVEAGKVRNRKERVVS